MSNKTKAIIAFILWTMLCVSLTAICVNKTNQKCRSSTEYIDTQVYVDTVTVYKPVSNTTAKVGTSTYLLPRRYFNIDINKVDATQPVDSSISSKALFGTQQHGVEAGVVAIPDEDSIAVNLPIIQRHYKDSLYEAWVSGPIDPQLDSIAIFNRREISTIRQTVYKPPNRWHIGVTAGYGYSPQGFQPYIGIGITYSIFSF